MYIPILYCTHRYQSEYDKREYEYCFIEVNDKTFYKIRARFVKDEMAAHRIYVINLKLNSNDTIQFINDKDIDARVCKLIPSKRTWSGVHTKASRNYTKIQVKDLISGHIINHDIFEDTKNGKIKSGEVIKIQRQAEDHIIAGIGYVLNDTTIARIKHAYGPECTLEIMDAIGVRGAITTDPAVRKRLASFYSRQMYNARYMHMKRIKSTSAKNFFNVIKNRYMNVKFVESDPNLIYLLFLLYGHHMYTFEHSVDVAIYACLLYKVACDQKGCDINYDMLDDLFLCGLLHDIGKLYMPVHIIDKKGKYNQKDNYIMYKHPEDSYKILVQVCNCDSNIFSKYKNNQARRNRLLDGAHYHHVYYEKTDANKSKSPISYPVKLEAQSDNSNKIFLALITAADKLDGMLSPRIYRVRKGEKAEGDMRDYIGLEKAKEFLLKDAHVKVVNVSIIRLLTSIMMQDSEAYDVDDDYGEKITNIGFNVNLITKFDDITKDDNYVARIEDMV